MSEWKECKLGDLINEGTAKLQTGPFGTMLNASEYVSNGIPVIAVQDIADNKLIHHKFVYVDIETASRLSRYCVKENDIIFGRKGAVERRAIIKKSEEGWLQGSDCIRLRFTELIYPQFISYQFGSQMYKDWMAQNSTGATMPSLNQDVLKQLPIRFPTFSEQKSIAQVLSSIDNKIDLLHRQNATLEAMAETLFRQWFVEEAKEDWEIVKLDTLILISSGKGLKRDDFCKTGKYPVLGANGEIGRTNMYLLDEKLLFTGRVGTLGNIFRVENEKVWLSDNTLIIKAIEYYNFIYFILKAAKLDGYNVGSTQPLIRQSDLKEIEVNLPPNTKLVEFEEQCDILFRKISQNQAQIRTLTTLRDTLLPKLMSGEVRVKM